MLTTVLEPGTAPYQAYIGPPGQYDFMGASQFRLLCALGLRSTHHLLDFGCGSLRAGRLLIPYLERCRYFGVEPNRWLVQEGIENQLGNDLVRMKSPKFDHNERFAVDMFGVRFDFILAQSIFSHTGAELVRSALKNFRQALSDDGVIVATFVEGESDFSGAGWIYPECVTFRTRTIHGFAQQSGLFSRRIPWYHPRQTWFVFAKQPTRLPRRSMLRHLTGAVLNEPDFAESWSTRAQVASFLRRFSGPFPAPLRRLAKKVLAVR